MAVDGYQVTRPRGLRPHRAGSGSATEKTIRSPTASAISGRRAGSSLNDQFNRLRRPPSVFTA
jgi:hypothetical protein